MLKRRKTSFWLCVLLLLAAGARLIGIDAQSIWFDEGWSAYAAGQPTLWAAANADATNPPLYYMLIHLQVLATGESALALRWLSYALGMLATVLVVPLARRVTGSRAAAVLALAVAALSAPLWWASQEMRMYTLLAVLVGVMALAWERLRTRPTAGAWAALLLAELAALYAHNTGPVIVLWLNVATLLAWLVNRRPRLARWVAGQVLVGALWLPYFEARFLSVADANQALVRRTLPGIDVWAAFWLAPWEAITRNPQTALWVGVGVLLVLPLVAWRRSGVRWLALHVLLLTAGLLAALAVLGNEFHGRYLVMAVPLVCVLAGSAAASERWLAGRYRAALVVLLMCCAVGREPELADDPGASA